MTDLSTHNKTRLTFKDSSGSGYIMIILTNLLNVIACQIEGQKKRLEALYLGLHHSQNQNGYESVPRWGAQRQLHWLLQRQDQEEIRTADQVPTPQTSALLQQPQTQIAKKGYKPAVGSAPPEDVDVKTEYFPKFSKGQDKQQAAAKENKQHNNK